jgi:hypothetical protein
MSVSSSSDSTTPSAAGGTRSAISPMACTAERASSTSTPLTYSLSSATTSRALAALATLGSTASLYAFTADGSLNLQKNCLYSSSNTPGARSMMSAAWLKTP